MKIPADNSKCKGQSPEGGNVCAYRETCLRFKAEPTEVHYKEFWKSADTDCVHYLSVPRQ